MSPVHPLAEPLPAGSEGRSVPARTLRRNGVDRFWAHHHAGSRKLLER